MKLRCIQKDGAKTLATKYQLVKIIEREKTAQQLQVNNGGYNKHTTQVRFALSCQRRLHKAKNIGFPFYCSKQIFVLLSVI